MQVGGETDNAVPHANAYELKGQNRSLQQNFIIWSTQARMTESCLTLLSPLGVLCNRNQLLHCIKLAALQRHKTLYTPAQSTDCLFIIECTYNTTMLLVLLCYLIKTECRH